MKYALVIDDEYEICETLKEQLVQLGFETAYAVTGEQALKMMKERTWNLFVVDLKLATAVNGLDVISAIRKSHQDAIVVAMTGFVDVGLRQEAERLGVNEYLAKPDDIMPSVFTGKINRLLNG